MLHLHLVDRAWHPEHPRKRHLMLHLILVSGATTESRGDRRLRLGLACRGWWVDWEAWRSMKVAMWMAWWEVRKATWEMRMAKGGGRRL